MSAFFCGVLLVCSFELILDKCYGYAAITAAVCIYSGIAWLGVSRPLVTVTGIAV